MTCFLEVVTKGDWNVLEMYLTGLINVDDYRYFEIQKQKCFEALDKRDGAKVVDILVKNRKIFAAFDEKLVKEITQLLIFEDFSDDEQLSNGCMANPTHVPRLSASARPIAPKLRRPRTSPTNNPAMNYHTTYSKHVLKRLRPFGISAERQKKRI